VNLCCRFAPKKTHTKWHKYSLPTPLIAPLQRGYEVEIRVPSRRGLALDNLNAVLVFGMLWMGFGVCMKTHTEDTHTHHHNTHSTHSRVSRTSEIVHTIGTRRLARTCEKRRGLWRVSTRAYQKADWLERSLGRSWPKERRCHLHPCQPTQRAVKTSLKKNSI
jgi:hypothetical protein